MKALYTHKQKVTVSTPTGKQTLTVAHHYEHSAPLLTSSRRAFYLAQNGGRPLTVRQERAIRKAGKRSVRRAADLLAR